MYEPPPILVAPITQEPKAGDYYHPTTLVFRTIASASLFWRSKAIWEAEYRFN